jgi:hypothetical protein
MRFWVSRPVIIAISRLFLDSLSGRLSMQKKHCPVCNKEVYWLVHHLYNVTDRFAVEQLKYDFSGWTEEDGLCLPCLERHRKYNLAGCYNIRITVN